MASVKEAVIYTSLVFCGIIVSTLFSFLLTYSPFAFIALLTLYVVGFSVFIFVYLLLNRYKFMSEDQTDGTSDSSLGYQIAMYVSMFNTLFSACMFLVAIVLRKRIYKTVCGY